MSSQLQFWVVVRDSKGKWTTVYDPYYRIEVAKGEELAALRRAGRSVQEGQRFVFEVRAKEYEKLMTKKDKAAQEALAARQGELL